MLAEVVRAAGVGWYIWEPDVTAQWSASMCATLGLPPDHDPRDVERFFALVHPDDRARVREAWARARETAEVPAVTYRIIRPDGALRYIRGQGTAAIDPETGGRRITGTVQDVTDAIEGAVRLERALALLTETQRVTGVGSYVYDLSAGTIEWTDELYHLLGVPLGTTITPDVGERVFHPEDRARRHRWAERVARGEAVAPIAMRVVLADGSVRHIELRARCAVGDDGRRRVLGTCIDVSPHALIDERQQHSARMEAIGTLAAGVAHDVNNALAIMFLNLAGLRRATPASASARDALRETERSAEQCAALTRQLLAFARKAPASPANTDVVALVRTTAGLFERLVAGTLRVALEVPERALITEADAAQLEAALMNLAVNARDATPAGGTVRLALDERVLEGDDPRLDPGAAPGRYAHVRVSDTGAGIEAQHLPRIFDPYFSTKALGKGTGLGLASVYATVRQHGGFIQVETAPGAGTTFHVYLPLRPRGQAHAGTQPASRAAQTSDAGANGEVLVVESVPALRALLASELSAAGLRVRTAGSGAEALAELRGAAGPPDVVVTDVVMPDMPAEELLRALRGAGATSLVLMTGYADEELLRRVQAAHPDAPVLFKPFTGAELLSLVRGALDARSAG